MKSKEEIEKDLEINASDERYRFFKHKNAKSDVWVNFELIEFEGKVQDFARCIHCTKVLRYVSKTGTASLLRHKCSLQYITACKTNTNTDSQQQSNVIDVDDLPLNTTEDEIVKTKWKTLRDGYNKYKKHVKQNTASGKISHPYIWSSQLSFLDDMNATTSNNTSSENKPLQCSREATPSLESNDSRDINFVELPSFNLPVEETSLQSFNLPQEEKSPSEVDIAVSTSQVRIESNQPKSKKRPLQGDVDKVIDYLHDRKKKKQDGIDLLFLSYAETFRKLSPRHQVHIKLELAKLFADAELECLEETVDIKPSFTALSSPSHSTISSSNANSSQQQPEQHNPFQDVDQPEYYLPDHC